MTIQQINPTVPVRRGLAADPEAKHYRCMKQAIWLYLYLLLAVNRATGQRLILPAVIAREMGLSEETVRSWLGHLRKSGYITLRSDGKLMRVRITKWSPDVGQPRDNREDSGARPRRPDGQLDPKELAQLLGGEPDDPFWIEAVTATKPQVLRQVLAEVTRVPGQRIRKSRVALFRYLLKKHQRS